MGFDLLLQTNFSVITPPLHTSYNHGSCQRIPFPPTALQINVATLNKSGWDLTLILPLFTSVVPSHSDTRVQNKLNQSPVLYFSSEMEVFILLVLCVSSSLWRIPIIQKRKPVKDKVFHRICFFLLTFRSERKVFSLQDCTPSCLLRGDLLSSHFTPGIKSAHTQTYTHKVENIRPYTYISLLTPH